MSNARPAEKKVLFGCWSNEPQRINELGQAGLLHPRVFETAKAASDYYAAGRLAQKGDVIVRITVEALQDA